MTFPDLEEKIATVLSGRQSRTDKAATIAEIIRIDGSYRWIGIYDVDVTEGIVSNIAWSGPSGPEFPVFPIDKGLTSRAIAAKHTVNVGDVEQDPDYLTALGSTRSEIILPILSLMGDRIVGTLDVDGELHNAFDNEKQTKLEKCALLLAGLWHMQDA